MTATLDVQYFGVNLSDPRGVVYRYQLEGLDTGWQDAGPPSLRPHKRPAPIFASASIVRHQ